MPLVCADLFPYSDQFLGCFSSYVFTPVSGHIEEISDAVEVANFNQAEYAESGTESQDASNIGEKVNKPKQFAPLMTHEVKLVEEDVDNGKVVLNVAVVEVFRVSIYKIQMKCG